MSIGKTLAGLALVAAFAATTVASSAQNTITLYNGTVINTRLNETLDSSSANVGDTFTMAVVPPYPSGDPAFQGATISGVVTKVVRAGQGRNPEIVIHPRYIRMPDGTIATVYGDVTSIAANKSTGGTAGKAAAGALLGMLVGNAIGKTIFHSSAGGAIGLIGGAMLGANNKTNFTIPAGANATVQLSQQVTIRRQASQP
ncbi:MAG: hypothetical protein JO192_02725 [Candidatus Eremiobacteraeota bacterium]|nr:hypothetical protein [Candidatus Eremiobacteraeota bacterium]MBV8721582.1 hypothetical protein [Candidatus Eremiobacteraeota bacterium]